MEGCSYGEQGSPSSNCLPRARTASSCALSTRRECFCVTRMARSIGCCGTRTEDTPTVRASADALSVGASRFRVSLIRDDLGAIAATSHPNDGVICGDDERFFLCWSL